MRLAIIIEGAQNSGKTSTIKELISLYTGRKLKQMKKGWQTIFLNSTVRSLRLICYCIPASPSETGIKIEERLKSSFPDVIIVAEQPSGKLYVNTHDYLSKNGYTILSFKISNKNGTLDWERFDGTTKTLKLKNRADEIVREIRKFIVTNKII